MFYVKIKSGTNGYYDEDNCDMLITEIPSNNIPSKDDVLELGMKRYLVREVKRVYNLKSDKTEFGEWVYVYVINA